MRFSNKAWTRTIRLTRVRTATKKVGGLPGTADDESVGKKEDHTADDSCARGYRDH